MLPQSHVLPTTLLNVSEHPIAARGPYDVYKASLGPPPGSTIGIALKVAHPLTGSSSRYCSKDTTKGHHRPILVISVRPSLSRGPRLIHLIGMAGDIFPLVSLLLPARSRDPDRKNDGKSPIHGTLFICHSVCSTTFPTHGMTLRARGATLARLIGSAFAWRVFEHECSALVPRTYYQR
jgi:hypothetical protein